MGNKNKHIKLILRNTVFVFFLILLTTACFLSTSKIYLYTNLNHKNV